MFRFLLVLLLLAFPLAPQADELSNLQDDSITLAKKLRSGEGRLAKLASKQAKLDARITDARTRIDENRDEIDALLHSLIRLSRTPPEAVVAMPGELRHTLQAAQLMTQLTGQLQSKTLALSKTLKRLKSDELNLAETRANVQQQQSQLRASQKALQTKLVKQKAVYQKRNKESFAKKAKQASIAKRTSKDVKQLVTKLEKKKAKPTVSKGLPFSKQRGRLKLPVAGSITKRFGQKEGVDQTSHGYRLASASGSTVVSPASGEVMYTGPFLDYGNIVILRFDNGYHLLLAGLENINCSVGQKMRTGQPVGRLKGSNNAKADLYMELRKNGKPIDPSPWFG